MNSETLNKLLKFVTDRGRYATVRIGMRGWVNFIENFLKYFLFDPFIQHINPCKTYCTTTTTIIRNKYIDKLNLLLKRQYL